MPAFCEPRDPSAPLRIGMLVPYDLAPHAGGVRQHALHLKRAFERRGDSVALLGPTSDASGYPNDPERGVYALPGVVTVPVNGSRSAVGMLVSPWRLLRLCRALKLDVLHLHEPQVPTMAWGLCWGLRQVPKVATFHAADESDSIVWLRRVSGGMVYRAIDRGITVSAASERRTRQTWPRQLARIPNGVCTKTFRPTTGPRRPGAVRFLSVGALGDSRKGARPLLRAFERLRSEGIEAELTMVGAQQGFEAGDLPPGVVLREGLTDAELACAFQDCDALVAPAIGRESFGMILLEAMASAKPVISSDIEGYRDVLLPEGSQLVPPNDPQALARALREMVELPQAQREQMGQANLLHAQKFAWEHVAESIRHEYLQAIAGRARQHARAGALPPAEQAPC